MHGKGGEGTRYEQQSVSTWTLGILPSIISRLLIYASRALALPLSLYLAPGYHRFESSPGWPIRMGCLSISRVHSPFHLQHNKIYITTAHDKSLQHKWSNKPSKTCVTGVTDKTHGTYQKGPDGQYRTKSMVMCVCGMPWSHIN